MVLSIREKNAARDDNVSLKPGKRNCVGPVSASYVKCSSILN